MKQTHKKALDLLFYEVTSHRTNERPYNCGENATSFHVDVYSDDACFYIEAELPGISIQDIHIQYEDNYLEIEAYRSRGTPTDGRTLIRGERCYGKYKRSFYIESIDENQIEASYASGVLYIKIPKNQKGARNARV
ncbi:MAG: Hsp20 family protein [Bacillota bacterium]|nr:Hsp20 family protein [Bacillota bacterium]